MINPGDFYNILKENGVDFFTGVPDSTLKDFCSYITDNVSPEKNITSANEGGAIGLATGYHLATGKIPLVFMQNSGQGNATNPLASLADKDVYSIPMLLVIGWRGEPGKKDEPQHIKQGKITIGLLETLEIPYTILPEDLEKAREVISKAFEIMKETNHPCALVIKKGTFEKYELQNKTKTDYELNREGAIKLVTNELSDSDVVVSTTGKTSRELFEYREELGQDHSRDFLTVGSMGHSSKIALGIALSEPGRQVYCFDGDGAIIMHMGSLAIIAQKNPKNFKHIVFNNGAHDSVGGQPTAGFNIDIPTIAKASGYREAWRAETSYDIREKMQLLKNSDGPCLLEIRVNKGARKELGRPTTTPIENKEAFMRNLKGNKPKAVILAAGMGKRMGGSIDKPKCLVEINGIPIIKKQIESLKKSGIYDISVVTGWKKEKVIECCKDEGIKFYENPKFAETGVLETLYCASEKMEGDLIVLYGDIYVEESAIKKVVESKCDFCSAIEKGSIFKEREQQFETYHGKEMAKGQTKVSIENGFITMISKSIPSENISGEAVGISKFSKRGTEKVLKRIENLIKTGDVKDYPGISNLFRYFILMDEKISPVFVESGDYAEIDYYEDYLEAVEKFEKKIVKAVIFDSGDIVHFRDKTQFEALVELLKTKGIEIDVPTLMNIYDSYALECYKGKINKDEHLKRIIAHLKVDSSEEFFNEFANMFRGTKSKTLINPKIENIFSNLKERGIKVGILTDTVSKEESRWNFFRENGLDHLIDSIVCSIDSGYVKNEKESYLNALSKLSVSPREAIFVGHQKYEMEGAKLAGVKSVSLEKGIGEDIFLENIEDLLKIL